jgi:hypothetical protein
MIRSFRASPNSVSSLFPQTYSQDLIVSNFHLLTRVLPDHQSLYPAVVETAKGKLAQGMRQLNGVYTPFGNRTHGRLGHVFRGRYKSILVEKDSCLLKLPQYVVLKTRYVRT